MSSALDTFKEILKENHCSLTSVRLKIYKLLADRETMSMHELVSGAKDIDRASVYRTVELFEQLGIAQRINIGWKYKIELTDRFSEHHHHLTCTHCGKTIAMSEEELESFIEQLAHAHGFTPITHQIEVQGICMACRNIGLQ